MKNHKSLAILIPMLFAGSTAVNAIEIFNKNGNKLELYGSINPNHNFSNEFLSTKISSKEDNTNAILGLSGKIKITDKLSSYAQIEYKNNFFMPEDLMNKQQPNTVRLGYAGLKYGNLGSIDYGRNYGVIHDAQSLTDHVPYINKKSIFAYNDNYMVGRNHSLLTYRNNNVFGLVDGISFALQYQDEIKNRDLNKGKSSSGWGASLKYESDSGLTAVGSCFTSERMISSNKKDLKNTSVDSYGLGFKYDANNVYVAAFYGSARNLMPYNMHISDSFINETQNIEAIAEYSFDSGFHPSLSYLDSKGQNSNSPKKELDLAKQINISTRYEFNKNVSTYMNYKINLLKENDFISQNQIPTDNTIGAGVVYQF
ncbi:porin [Buchnera aphidicola]|jgi:outer membrane pore protein F|uniref:Porin-like protein BUsg_347 n=1 Tax=Buchnera aphidicola subsp. Schizaphis graminum (strain Sg) TaxID=198804 RepID=PORL_BUCAP|nr:porin [Buchnera aphidicola]Q8K9I8.1 RecName: Full=Porin-like protein BUsg_347; Flags: Precursor [Buchnera aphidicola str. Sg (Schizaphis graminum)]AAM67900.1 outer membrane protein F precursor [Buchnera aphidicola str. Sg (Schizaphis graminum)]AWI49606.1 porin-like protein [Buchnera aphidicola (Schizaphis graminum)]